MIIPEIRRSDVIRDNDDKFGKRFVAVAEGTGIDDAKILPRSPNLTPICERSLGSVRRERLDHVIILSKRQPRRMRKKYEYVQIYSVASERS